MTLEQREMVWSLVVTLLQGFSDPNTKAVIAQEAIAEFGPVPDSMGDAVREAMK